MRLVAKLASLAALVLCTIPSAGCGGGTVTVTNTRTETATTTTTETVTETVQATAKERQELADRSAALRTRERAVAKREKAVRRAERVIARSTFGDGTYLVGKDIPAGSYVARNASSQCYWARSNKGGDIIDNYIGAGQARVTVYSGELFNTQDCGTWRRG